MTIQLSSVNLRSIALLLLIVTLSSLSFSQVREQPDSTKPYVTPDSTWRIPPLTEPIDQERMSDEDWLLLPGRVPSGITYEETKRLFPNLGEQTTEGAGSMAPKYELYEAYLQITIFDVPAKIEFNFSKNSLYGYGFRIWDIDSVTAEPLYAHLKDFYSKRYGKYEESSDGGNWLSKQCFWNIGDITVNIVMNIYSADKAYVGWGG